MDGVTKGVDRAGRGAMFALDQEGPSRLAIASASNAIEALADRARQELRQERGRCDFMRRSSIEARNVTHRKLKPRMALAVGCGGEAGLDKVEWSVTC